MRYSLQTLEYDKVLKNLSENCITTYAKDEFLKLLPSNNFEIVENLLNETYFANKLLVSYGFIEFNNLDSVLEIIEFASKGGTLTAEEILKVLALVEVNTKLSTYFNNPNISKDDKTVFDGYLKSLNSFTKLKTAITLAIAPDGRILDQASKTLFQIRRQLNLSEAKLRNTLNVRLQQDSHKLQEPLIVMRNSRMCLPYKIEYKNSISGIVHDISQSNSTCYIEPQEAVILANEYESTKALEQAEIHNILVNLSLLVSAHSVELLNSLDSIIKLDIIFAKGKAAGTIYLKPNITKEKTFNIDNVCHPLIPRDVCVPLSLKMKEGDSTLIITGPNTGGKTVALKTVGLTSLLVQTGIFVDTKRNSTYHIYDYILADIGDEQSIEESLSTFSSHMTGIINILSNPLDNALVLLDELGSGTDPKEGSALALAIIEELRKRKATSLISTHYTDLKNYAYNNKGVINASVEFNFETLKPTYRLLLGIPGQSNALLIAANLGLDTTILNSAYGFLDNNNTNVDTSVYETKLLELQQKEDSLKLAEQEIQAKLESITKEKVELEKNRSVLIQKAVNDAAKIVSDAKAEGKEIIAELKALKNASYKDHELSKLQHELSSLEVKEDSENIFKTKLEIGDYVLIKSYNKYGYITKVKKGRFEVNLGQFTMDFKETELVKAVAPVKKVEKRPLRSGYNSVSGASMSLDLRGKRYEEVKELLDNFLDKALLQNFEQVSIIHGFGTGVVRNRVWELLKSNSHVKSYRYGKEGEGLNGATIVYLK